MLLIEFPAAKLEDEAQAVAEELSLHPEFRAGVLATLRWMRWGGPAPSKCLNRGMRLQDSGNEGNG